MNILTSLSVVSAVLGICVVVGGLFAMKQGYSKTSGEAQDRVINALKTEMELMKVRIADLEKKNIELNHVQETIVSALDQEGFKVTIDGDMVTVVDRHGARSNLRRRATPIQAIPAVLPKKQQPKKETL